MLRYKWRMLLCLVFDRVSAAAYRHNPLSTGRLNDGCLSDWLHCSA